MKTNSWRAVAARGGGLVRGLLPCFMLGGVVFSSSAQALPLEAYGRLPSLEGVALSRDGSRVAYVRTEGDSRIVVIASIAENKMIRWVRVGEEKLRELRWADDDNVLLTTSVTSVKWGFKDEWSLLRVYNITRNEIRELPGKVTGDGPGSETRVFNNVAGRIMVRSIDGHTVVFVSALYEDRWEHNGISLFRCDLTTGQARLYRAGTESTESWLVDGKGELAAEEVYDKKAQRWAIKVPRTGGYREAASGIAPLDAPTLLGFGQRSDTLLLQGVDNGRNVWKVLSLNNGGFNDPGQQADVAVLDPLTDQIIGGVRVDERSEYVFFDSALQQRWKSLVAAFDGDAVSYISASRDFSKILVLVEGPKYGYRYQLIDLNKMAAVPIGKVYSGLDTLLEVRRIDYPAGDGLSIPAYLTLPRGVPPKKLPLVVMPHGGPATYDTAEFDWWSQALADQGYAVLRPNYRGSALERKFFEAGFGEWGRKMQTDLSDGVRYLAAQGIVDSARVCIVGASYGGYAALAGATLEQGVYRCAVSVAGISDLAQMMKWEGGGGVDVSRINRFWDRYWGVSGRTDPLLDTISPIKHVDAVQIPILLIHGRDDTVVPFEQSQLMFDALKRQKKDVELVALKKEDHWLSGSETRLQMLQATVAFLRAHNPPD